MFCKLFIFAVALVACVFANPQPQPEPKPGFLTGAAIASPYIASAPLAYGGAYGGAYAAPIAYGGLYGGLYGRTIYG